MPKARVILVDPAGDGHAAMAGVLHRRAWEASEVAYEEVERVAPDTAVVVALDDDDGAGRLALRQLRRAGHRAARILVCDADVGARCVARGEPAHQVVVRPASASKVVSAVQRALQVRELIADPAVRAVVSGFRSPPAMPRIWTRLTELLESETATMQDAARVVERDVGLAGKVLQLVNSGLYGLDRPIGSLLSAVQRLGIKTVRDLVLAAEVYQGGETLELPEAFGELPLVLTSHLVATAAQEVAPRAAVESAFSAGLFHQLGRLMFATQEPSLYRQVLDRHRAGVPLADAEREVFGADARLLAAWHLASWGLPHEVVEAVRWCDHPELASGRGSPLALSVFLAARLVREAELERQRGHPVVLVSRAELAPWGLADSLDGWRERVRDLLHQTRRVGAGQGAPAITT